MERKVYYGKKRDREKNPKKIKFQLIICSIAVFFDMDFPLKSVWTGPPGEILPSSSRAHIRH